MNVFLRKVESRFQVGKQVEQIAAQLLQRSRHSARELGERFLQLVAAAGLDDAQHGFRAGQIELAGEEGPQRELARPSGAGAFLEQFRDEQFDQRRTTDGVQFRDVLSGIGVRAGENVQIGRQRSGESGKAMWPG